MNILTKEQPSGGSATAWGPFPQATYSLGFADSLDQYGEIPMTPHNQYIDTNDFTISFWWKLNSPENNQFFDFQDSNINTAIHTSLGFMRIRFLDNVGGTVLTSNVNICDGDWHHLVILGDRDGSFDLFIDNSLNVSTVSGCTGNMVTGGSTQWWFGTNNPSLSQHANGFIDQFIVYDSLLGAGAISILYNGGSPPTTYDPLLPIAQARYEFDEGTGSTAAGIGIDAIDMDLFNSPTWGDPAS